MGVVNSKFKKLKAELFYLVERSPRLGNDFNLLQFGATILGESKCIFFTSMLALLRMYNPEMCNICYCDTGKESKDHVL